MRKKQSQRWNDGQNRGSWKSKCQSTQTKIIFLESRRTAGQKKLTGLKRIRCSEGAACSNGEDSKELGGKCALGFMGGGHEAEIALCIHYARCKLGVRCKNCAGQPTHIEILHNQDCSNGRVQTFLTLVWCISKFGCKSCSALR